MNRTHLDYLASAEWARRLETDLLPWIQRVADLGDDVLEVGPGPGLTTDILRSRSAKVTAIEVDAELARSLAARLAGTNVEVIEGDAARTGLPARRFSSATCFSVLHHIPTIDHQDRVLAEIRRLLQPGAALFAIDSRDIDFIRAAHADDTFVPLDESTLADRLRVAGFAGIHIEHTDFELRVTARTAPSTDATSRIPTTATEE